VSRRIALTGAIVAVVYVVMVAVTVTTRREHVRPLYDGFAPPSHYQWVDPPSFFTTGNVTPKAATTSISLGTAGSAAAGFGAPDGQFTVDLPRGAVAPRASEDHVALTITPLAATKFRPLPDGLRANGNVYRVDVRYARSGARVATLAKPGTMLVEIPEVGQAFFESRDGHTWKRVPSSALGARQLSLSSAFVTPGYFVSGTSLPELVASKSSTRNGWLAAGAVAAVAVVLIAGAVFIARRRLRRVATTS
jgi:hypothetical protein